MQNDIYLFDTIDNVVHYYRLSAFDTVNCVRSIRKSWKYLGRFDESFYDCCHNYNS